MAKSTDKILALYCRSAVKNNKLIKKQKDWLIAYAKESNVKNYKFYIDNGFSGTSMERPDLTRLLADVANNSVTEIAVTYEHVLSRGFVLFDALRQTFKESGVKYTVLSNPDPIELIPQIELPHFDYPICEACHQPMEENRGCTVSHIKCDNKTGDVM